MTALETKAREAIAARAELQTALAACAELLTELAQAMQVAAVELQAAIERENEATLRYVMEMERLVQGKALN